MSVVCHRTFGSDYAAVVAGRAATCPKNGIAHASRRRSSGWFVVTTLHRVVSDRRCGPGIRWRICHSASTSSCPRYPLTTLSGRLKDHAVRITFSWVALSIVVLSVGLLLVASLDDSLFVKGQPSVVAAPSGPPRTGVSAESTAPPSTTPAPSLMPPATAGTPSGSTAAMPSEQPAPPPASSAPAPSAPPAATPPAPTAAAASAAAPSARVAPVPLEQSAAPPAPTEATPSAPAAAAPLAPTASAPSDRQAPVPPELPAPATTAAPSAPLTAAAPSAPPSPRVLPAEAEMSVADRRQVQDALRRLDYYKGPVDGIFGSLTRAAIRRFQQQTIGADATGHLTADQANRLVTPR